MRARHILQCARTIGPGYGVSGPTYELERCFVELGCSCERFSLEDLGWRSQAMPSGQPWLALARLWRDILLFSTLGSLKLWWKFGRRPRPGTTVLCQVDALYGDIFVVRSLHKSFLAGRSDRHLMMLRNPLHALVLLRDWLRFKTPIHRHFVALSEANKRQVVELYGVDPERITVIPNGVDLKRFKPDPTARRDIRLSLGLTDEQPVAIFAGHEFERKGLKLLLEAMRRLKSRGSAWRLLVAGRDSSQQLRAEFGDIGERVFYLGHRSDLERYYAAADVFVLPALFDVSPLVGPEALASGLPLLMTDVGGVAEYLEAGRNGLFASPDPEDLANKLRQLEDPRMLAQLASHSRSSVAHRDWSRVAAQFLMLFERLEL